MNQSTNNLRLPEQNNVILVGRLTRDPELRRTGTGKAVCSFDIAIGKRMRDAATGEWKDADPVYVPIVVWAEQGERCGERLKKGFPVHVEGRLQSSNWQATDGTKRSRLEVVASRVQFLSIVKQSDSTIGSKPVENLDSPQESSSFTSDDDEDIPF